MAKRMSKIEKENKMDEISKELDLQSIEKPKFYYFDNHSRIGHCTVCGSDLVKRRNPTNFIEKEVCPIHEDEPGFLNFYKNWNGATTKDILSIFPKGDELIFAVIQYDLSNKNDLNWKIARATIVKEDELYTLRRNSKGDIIKDDRSEFSNYNFNNFHGFDFNKIIEDEELMFRSGLAEVLIGYEESWKIREAFIRNRYLERADNEKPEMPDVNRMSRDEKLERVRAILNKIQKAYANNLISFLIAYKSGKSIERIAKSELLPLAVDLFTNYKLQHTETLKRIVDIDESSLNRSLGAPVDLIRETIKRFNDINPSDITVITKSLYQQVKNKDEVNELFDILEDSDMSKYEIGNVAENVKFLLEQRYKMKHLLSYLRRADRYQALLADDTLQYLKDYVNMSNDLGIKYDKFPRDLRLKHDLTLRDYKFKMDDIMAQKFTETIEANKKFEYKDDEFAILAPNSAEDIIKEGKEQSHCVASYVKSVANRESIIVFLRKRPNEDQAFATIEISPNNAIRQISCKFNRSLTDVKAKKFLKKWAEEKRLIIN